MSKRVEGKSRATQRGAHSWAGKKNSGGYEQSRVSRRDTSI